MRLARPWIVIVVTVSGVVARSASAPEKTTFQDHVLPLVETYCSKCHNADKKKADLDLTSHPGVLKGSGSGPVVTSANLDGSKLWKVLNHAEESFMPPNRPKIPDPDLEIFKKWIIGGLLETSGSKAVTAAKPSVDLTLKLDASGKPDGPPPMPGELPLEPVVHSARGNPIIGLAASPWAPLVAVAGQKQVLLFHSDTLEPLGILPFTDGQPAEVVFSRSGKLLLAAGGRAARSGRVMLWDVVKGEHLMTLGDDYDTVLAADVRADQSQVAMGGPGRLVKILSTGTGALLHKIKKHTDWVTAVAYSPNGSVLATGDRNGGISLWDPDNAQELFALAGHKAAVWALRWRADSKILASAGEDGAVKLWETQEGKQVKTWTAHGKGVLGLNFARDGRLASCGRDNAVTLWDANGAKQRSLDFSGELPLRVAFSHDGKRVFGSDFAGRVLAWNPADGKPFGELDANPLPLKEQIAAVEKRVAELERLLGDNADKVKAAESETAAAARALDAAKKSLQTAQTERTAKESGVAQLKQLATNAPPPDISAQLAAARAARQKAREAVTNATQVVVARTREVEAARTKLAGIKPAGSEETLRAERLKLNRLNAAQAFTAVFRARTALAEKKRALDHVQTQLAAKPPADEAARLDATARQLAKEVEAEEARLKRSSDEFERVKAAAAKPKARKS